MFSLVLRHVYYIRIEHHQVCSAWSIWNMFLARSALSPLIWNWRAEPHPIRCNAPTPTFPPVLSIADVTPRVACPWRASKPLVALRR